MFVGIYRFEGRPHELLAAYDRLMASMPRENLELHVCTQDKDGMKIYDACPTKEAFIAFSNGEMLRKALAAAGLPRPEIEFIGDVHTVFWGGKRML